MYGNLNNRIIERATVGQPTPVVGMPATITYYSDRHAATVVDVFNAAPKGALYVTVQEDKVIADPAKAPHAMGHQDWLCTPDPNGRLETFRWDPKRGRWDACVHRFSSRPNDKTGRWVISRGEGLGLGAKRHYYHWEF